MNLHLTSYGQGKPLVFFHGWGFNSQIWQPLVPKLQHSHQVILVDLPGFGKSDFMEWSLFKEILLSKLPDQFALVGWSMGGLYATRLAIESENRVSKLFNVTTSPRFIMDDNWPGVSKDLFVKFYNNLSTDIRATLNDFILLQAKMKKIEFRIEAPPTEEALFSGLDLLNKWDLRKELNELQIPTTYLFGGLDPITTAKTIEAMQVSYPQFNYLLFQKSAHMPFISHQEDFIESLLGFIQ